MEFPVDFASHSDVNPLLEDQMGMDFGSVPPLPSQQDSIPHSEATSWKSVDLYPPSMPLHTADDKSRGSPGTEVPPQCVQCIYHRQMNGKLPS